MQVVVVIVVVVVVKSLHILIAITKLSAWSSCSFHLWKSNMTSYLSVNICSSIPRRTCCTATDITHQWVSWRVRQTSVTSMTGMMGGTVSVQALQEK